MIDRRHAAQQAWPSTLERRHTTPKYRPGGREVLLVDDDIAFVETMAALLARRGFTVMAEFSQSAALRYLSTHTPDALVTDLRLGDGDGWTLVRYATRNQPSLPVIIVTGWSASEHEADMRIPVFFKPFDPDSLLNYLASVLTR
jgi:DNA-binding response OmpR family regulator